MRQLGFRGAGSAGLTDTTQFVQCSLTDCSGYSRFMSFPDIIRSPEELKETSAVIIVAHPDDEVVGTGGLFPKFGRTLFVLVTNGSPENLSDAIARGFASSKEYSEARSREFNCALNKGHIPSQNAILLNIQDQETAFRLKRLILQLTTILLDNTWDFILTHTYEGGHPDHDATAFAVHAALRNLGLDPESTIIEFPLYHLDNGTMKTSCFPSAYRDDKQIVIHLSAEEMALKQKMINCYKTQSEILSRFSISREVFRPAPRYVFHKPPHPGGVFYDHFDLGIDGATWRRYVLDICTELNIVEPL